MFGLKSTLKLTVLSTFVSTRSANSQSRHFCAVLAWFQTMKSALHLPTTKQQPLSSRHVSQRTLQRLLQKQTSKCTSVSAMATLRQQTTHVNSSRRSSQKIATTFHRLDVSVSTSASISRWMRKNLSVARFLVKTSFRSSSTSLISQILQMQRLTTSTTLHSVAFVTLGSSSPRKSALV